MNGLSMNVRMLSLEEAEECLLPIPEASGRTAHAQGSICLRMGQQVLLFPDSAEGKRIAQTIRDALAKEQPGSADIHSLWKRLLTGPDAVSRDSAIRALGKVREVSRCVIVFRNVPEQSTMIDSRRFAELAPMEPGDVLTDLEEHTVALIKQIREHSPEDIAEYAAAVIETVEGETGIRFQAGIGNAEDSLRNLHRSAEQAMLALDTANHFHSESQVAEYRKQSLERLILSIPPQERSALRHELFSPGMQRIMNEEMKNTISVFFQNDLNISTASRQLFIHRNTLNYRLEKIRRETGYDLRTFHDAAVFMILNSLPAEE